MAEKMDLFSQTVILFVWYIGITDGDKCQENAPK